MSPAHQSRNYRRHRFRGVSPVIGSAQRSACLPRNPDSMNSERHAAEELAAVKNTPQQNTHPVDMQI
jgi:hypothetical protein